MTTSLVLMIVGFVCLVFAATGVPNRFGLQWGWTGMALWCLATIWPALAGFGVLYVLLVIVAVLLIILILKLAHRPLI